MYEDRGDNQLKSFKVYYFVGDYWSSKGETRRYEMIRAHSELEAEIIFKSYYPERNFGWVDER